MSFDCLYGTFFFKRDPIHYLLKQTFDNNFEKKNLEVYIQYFNSKPCVILLKSNSWR